MFKSLFKGTLVLSIMSVATQLGSMILLPIYSELMTPEMFGIVGLITSFSTIITTVMSIGLSTAESRDLIELDERTGELGEYLFTVNSTLVVVSILGLGALLTPLTREGLINLFGLSNISFHYILFGYISSVLALFIGMINVFYNFKQIFLKRAIVTLVVFVISNFAALAIIFIYSDGALGKLVGKILSQAMIVIYLGYSYFRVFRPRINLGYLKSSLSIGIPVTLTGIFASVAFNGNRFIMNKELSLSIVGQYTIAWTITSPINILFSSFHVVWIPIFFSTLKKSTDNRKIEDNFITILILINIFILTIQIYIKDITILLLNERYYESAYLAVLLMPYFLTYALTTLIANYLIFFKVAYWLTIIYIVLGMLSLGLNFIIIPLYGIVASILLMTVTQILVTVATFFVLYLKFGIVFRYRIYMLLVGTVFNPITIFIASKTIDRPQTFILKLCFLIFMYIFLLYMMPKKRELFQKVKLSVFQGMKKLKWLDSKI